MGGESAGEILGLVTAERVAAIPESQAKTGLVSLLKCPGPSLGF